jgi:hypothetical protein
MQLQTYQECNELMRKEEETMSKSGQRSPLPSQKGDLWKFLVKPLGQAVSAQRLDSIPEIFSGIMAQTV